MFDAVAHAQRQVAGLPAIWSSMHGALTVVAHNVLPRDDLRAAAEPLHDFWVKVADAVRSATGAAGGPNPPAVRFLHSCLEVLDGTAKLDLIAKLPFKP